MTDAKNPGAVEVTQADKEFAESISYMLEHPSMDMPKIAEKAARHRIAALSPASQSVEKMREALRGLIAAVERSGAADDKFAALFEGQKTTNGQPIDKAAKEIRRAVNEGKAALSTLPHKDEATPAPQDEGFAWIEGEPPQEPYERILVENDRGIFLVYWDPEEGSDWCWICPDGKHDDRPLRGMHPIRWAKIPATTKRGRGCLT